MKIYPVTDPSFRLYGEPITHGYNVSELLRAMEAIPLPEEGTAYEPAIEAWKPAPSSPSCRTGPTAACPSSWACAGAATPSSTAWSITGTAK